MTSPDNFTPDGAYTGDTLHEMQDVTQADVAGAQHAEIQDLLSEVAETFIDNLLGGFADIPEAIGDFLSELAGAITGTNAGTGALTDIFDRVVGIQNVGVENATSIAAINAALGGESGSGVYFVDTFDRADSASLGSDWTTVDPGGVDILIANNQAVAGTSTTGAAFAVCNTVTLGDNMSAAAVMGDPLSGFFYDSAIHVRMNTAATAWAYLNVFKNKVYLGRATRSGTSVTYTDWVSVTSGISINNGTQVELRAEGTTYRAYVAGKLVAAYTDSGASHPVGASYRSVGFKVRNDTIGRSAAFSSFAMADITVPATLGTGWTLYRNATGGSTATTWGTSGVALGSDTFDVEDRKANVVVDNLGLGRIKTVKAGFYSISLSLFTTLAKIGAAPALLGGTSTGSMTLIECGQPSEYLADGNTDLPSGIQQFQASWVVYLPADYYVQPAGFRATGSSSTSVSGGSSAYKTKFTGALM